MKVVGHTNVRRRRYIFVAPIAGGAWRLWGVYPLEKNLGLEIGRVKQRGYNHTVVDSATDPSLLTMSLNRELPRTWLGLFPRLDRWLGLRSIF